MRRSKCSVQFKMVMRPETRAEFAALAGDMGLTVSAMIRHLVRIDARRRGVHK